MNWGWKIAIVYSSFAIMVLAFVFITSSRKVNLVEDNYYEKEIAYQDQIDKIKNTQAIGNDFQLNFVAETKVLEVTDNEKTAVRGSIHFYRPSDSDKDMNVDLKLDDNGFQSLNLNALEKGLWVVKVDWETDGKSFYKSLQIELK